MAHVFFSTCQCCNWLVTRGDLLGMAIWAKSIFKDWHQITRCSQPPQPNQSGKFSRDTFTCPKFSIFSPVQGSWSESSTLYKFTPNLLHVINNQTCLLLPKRTQKQTHAHKLPPDDGETSCPTLNSEAKKKKKIKRQCVNSSTLERTSELGSK